MTNKHIERELNRVSVEFEQQCRAGLAADCKQKFYDYPQYCINLWETTGKLKPSTIEAYVYCLKRINAGIGHLKLCDIRPQHLNQLYTQLMQGGIRQSGDKAILRGDIEIDDTIRGLAARAGITEKTCGAAVHGKSVSESTAEKIASALGMDAKKLFNFQSDSTPLTTSTVRNYHNITSAILEHAFKEGIWD